MCLFHCKICDLLRLLHLHWRIQDFPDGGGGGNSWIWGKTLDLLFGKILAENGMKMKEIEPRGYVPSASLDPPMFYIGGCPVNIKK